MFRISIRCQTHKKPLQYIDTNSTKSSSSLLCEVCIKQMNPSSYMTIDQHSNKIKQMIEVGPRSKSGKKIDRALMDTQDSSIQGSKASKAIGSQQASLLEVIMKLLTEDKKKYHANIQESLASHRKLWMQYEESQKNLHFLNNLLKKNLLREYLSVQNIKGWSNMKQILKVLHHRSYVSNKIILQSQELEEQLKNSMNIKEDTVLKQIQNILAIHTKRHQRNRSRNGEVQGKKRKISKNHYAMGHHRAKSTDIK